MGSFVFQTVPHILVQAGAAASLGEILKSRFAPGRVCIVTDAFLYHSGLLQPALDSLQRSGWHSLVISDVQDPATVLYEYRLTPDQTINSLITGWVNSVVDFFVDHF